MTLYTAKEFHSNYEARLGALNEIHNIQNLITLHTNANRPALAKSAMGRLATAQFRLYRLNKDYDEMLIANMVEEYPAPRKNIIKKLLRK